MQLHNRSLIQIPTLFSLQLTIDLYSDTSGFWQHNGSIHDLVDVVPVPEGSSVDLATLIKRPRNVIPFKNQAKKLLLKKELFLYQAVKKLMEMRANGDLKQVSPKKRINLLYNLSRIRSLFQANGRNWGEEIDAWEQVIERSLKQILHEAINTITTNDIPKFRNMYKVILETEAPPLAGSDTISDGNRASSDHLIMKKKKN